MQYAEELVVKELRHGDLYEEQNLDDILIKRLDSFMPENLRKCWTSGQ